MKSKNSKKAAEDASSTRATLFVAVAGLLLAVGGYKLAQTNILVDMTEDMQMGHTVLQAAFFGFCLNADAIKELADKSDAEAFDSHQRDMETTDFLNDGNINEDDYTKQSIYSLLYSVYWDVGALRFHGEKYQFRFNTWGLGGVFDAAGNRNGGAEHAAGPYKENHLTSYPATQPQRHGKTAYSSLLNFKTIKARMDEIAAEGRMVNVVEIGSGTGAGANELTWLHPNLNYTAVDMQARGAFTCRNIHGSAEARFTATMQKDGVMPEFSADTRLTCLHANGQLLADYLPDGFADIVLISETHIADVVPLDQETKNVFNQVKRLLRPGGHFVWGNAIPTSIWEDSFRYLGEIGLEKREVYDVTQQAVAARDEDFSRVEHFYKHVQNTYYALRMFPAW